MSTLDPNATPPQRPRLPVVAIVIGALFFVGLIGLLLFGVHRSGDADRESLPSALIGKPAPDFDLPVLHDMTKSVSKKDLKGVPFIVNVWGSWCPECRIEHPVITNFAFAQRDRVRVIGYNYKDKHEDALRWLEQFGNPYFVVLADESGEKAIDWGVYGAPETFLVDRKGIVVWKHVGPLSDELLKREVLPKLLAMETAP